MTDLIDRPLRVGPVAPTIRPLPEVSAAFMLRRLFSAGLALGSCVRLADPDTGLRLTRIIDDLDAIGAEVRRTAVTGDDRTDPGFGDSTLEPLIVEMAGAVGQLTDHMEALCRGGGVDGLPPVHLVSAVQSLQQALMYLDEPDRPNGPVRAS